MFLSLYLWEPFFLVSDITVIVLAIIPGFFGLIMLIAQAIITAQLKKVKDQLDGHMTNLLKTTASANKAEGVIEGKQEQKEKMVIIIEEKVKAAKDAGKIEGIEQANGKKNGEENSNQ